MIDSETFDPSQTLPIGKLPTGLLARLIATVGTDDPDVLVGAGIGRDAAAIAIGDRILVAKTDPITFAGKNAGAYLVDVNSNDLACLGANPRWLLVTALLPEGVTTGEVESLFAELHAASRRRGIAMVGGHTEITAGLDRTILVGLLLGEAAPDRLLTPGGARPGDRVLLTKALAIEGTALLAEELGDALAGKLGMAMVERARSLLAEPGLSVLADARTLLATGGITALHDITEGGLAMALREIAGAAGVGVVCDRASVPVLPETAALADALNLDPIGMLGSGSLVATATPSAVDALVQAGRDAGISVTEIGEIRPIDEGISVRLDHRVIDVPKFDTDEVSRALNEYRHQRGGKAAQ